MVLRGAENAAGVIKRVGDDRSSRGFGVGIRIHLEVIGFLDVVVLSVR